MLKCKNECYSSKDNPLFLVSVIVCDDRMPANDIDEKDPRDFKCVHCGGEVEEVKDEDKS